MKFLTILVGAGLFVFGLYLTQTEGPQLSLLAVAIGGILLAIGLGARKF